MSRALDDRECGHEFWSNSDGDPQCIHCGHVGHLCKHGRVEEHGCEECHPPICHNWDDDLRGRER